MRHEVERVPYLSAASFRERFEVPDRPVVIEGGARAWPALQRFQLPMLRQALGPLAASFKSSSSNAHPDFRRSGLPAMFARRTTSFAEFFDAITTGASEERCRLLFTGDEQFVLQRRQGVTRVHAPFEPLLSGARIPDWIPEERLYTVWAWFSGRGVRTWLHYDNNGCHNLNAQLTGGKTCLLMPPAELWRLSPFELGGDNPAYNCSSIDVESPDRVRYPEFEAVETHFARLDAGDLLFIPAWWFHTFRHEGEFNGNLNFWWKPERPRWNVVAARQALLDASAAALLDPRSDPASAALLRRLDRAAIARREE